MHHKNKAKDKRVHSPLNKVGHTAAFIAQIMHLIKKVTPVSDNKKQGSIREGDAEGRREELHPYE